MGIRVVPASKSKKGTVRERVEKIEDDAYTPMEAKYAGDIQ